MELGGRRDPLGQFGPGRLGAAGADDEQPDSLDFAY